MKNVIIVLLFMVLGSISIAAQKPTPSPQERPFLMPIEDVFVISGRGTVVVGKIERGEIKTGDAIEIVGKAQAAKATIVGINSAGKTVDQAKMDDNVSIILRGVTRDDVSRGMVIATPGSIGIHTRFRATINLLSAADGGRRIPFFTGYRPQILIRTGSFSGLITLPADKSDVKPGETGVTAEIELTAGAPIEVGMVVQLREVRGTVGTATITEILP